jgi:hypothetical protein
MLVGWLQNAGDADGPGPAVIVSESSATCASGCLQPSTAADLTEPDPICRKPSHSSSSNAKSLTSDRPHTAEISRLIAGTRAIAEGSDTVSATSEGVVSVAVIQDRRS